MLRKAELHVLGAVDEATSIVELAEQLDRSPNYVSEVVADLTEKNLVRKERIGREKRVTPTETKAVEYYHNIVRLYPHIDPPELLSGPTIPLLYYLNESITVAELAARTDNYRNTVHRRLRRLLDRGILRKDGSTYRLNEAFLILHEFASEYVHHTHRQRAAEAVNAFTILWENHASFLIQTEQQVTDEAFLRTGPEQFEAYDLPLFLTSSHYYVYPAERANRTPEELICHMLVIDSGSRYRSYCLLLFTDVDIDESRLLACGDVYGVREAVEQLLEYVETRGEATGPSWPTWDEFHTLADNYGVSL